MEKSSLEEQLAIWKQVWQTAYQKKKGQKESAWEKEWKAGWSAGWSEGVQYGQYKIVEIYLTSRFGIIPAVYLEKIKAMIESMEICGLMEKAVMVEHIEQLFE